MEIKAYGGTSLFHMTKVNLCDKKPKSDTINRVLSNWAIPDFCPVKENPMFCHNKSDVIKISGLNQKMLSLYALTRLNYTIKITHDTGTSCFQAMTSVVKI